MPWPRKEVKEKEDKTKPREGDHEVPRKKKIITKGKSRRSREGKRYRRLVVVVRLTHGWQLQIY